MTTRNSRRSPPAKPPNNRQGLFEALFEGSHLGIGISRMADGRFVEVNAAFLRLFGYSREDVLGRTSLELGMWPSSEERANLIERLGSGEAVTAFEAKLRRKTGELGAVSVSARLIDWAGEPHMVGFLTDITERKRMEDALRESEARLRLALAATHLPVFRQDRQLRYAWIVNPALGLGSEDIVGRTDVEVLGRKAAAPLVRIKNRAMREGRSLREEVWLEMEDRAGCFDLIVEPERDADGRVIGVLCASVDITERKLAEEALRASEERLRLAREAARIGVWDWDTVHGSLTWSEELIALYGFSRDGFPGTYEAFTERVHPEDLLAVERWRDTAVREGKPFDFEFRVVLPDASTRWVHCRGGAIYDRKGRARRIVGINIDITERKRAEQQLRMQADILATLEEGVNLIDAAGIIRYTNPKFDAMFGYSEGELLGQHASVLNAPDDVDPEQTAREILAALERDGHWRGEIRNRRKDGSAFWTRANIAAVRHPRLGRVWVSAQSDITALRRLRLERDAAHHALERLASHVQDEAEDLRREIAREVHDEIGAALTGIRMGLENLARASDQHDGLARLRGLVDRAMSDTRELCTRLRPPMLDDLGLAETCRWYLRDWSRQTGIPVEARLACLAAEPADALRTDLFRILQELVTNVARHAGARRVKVALAGNPRGLRLRVADDGRGFAADAREGIGLLGIRERLRRHGGDLELKTGPAGTTVLARVPGARP